MLEPTSNESPEAAVDVRVTVAVELSVTAGVVQVVVVEVPVVERILLSGTFEIVGGVVSTKTTTLSPVLELPAASLTV